MTEPTVLEGPVGGGGPLVVLSCLFTTHWTYALTAVLRQAEGGWLGQLELRKM